MFRPGEIEGIPLGIEKQFSDLEMRIMEDIVRRIKINGEITRAADWQIHRLHELGVSKRVIKKYIKDSLKLDSKGINHIYKNVIRKGYERDESLYKYKGKPMIPYEENAGLQQLIAAVSAQTNGEFKNITQTMGFAKRENGRLKFTNLSDYYQKTLDGAMLDITSGAFDYNTVLKRVVREMTNSGLRTVDYASGRSVRVEGAARNAVMTGVSQVTSKINEQNAKELDTEYFEVTCHGGARPSHQEWQGKVYSKKELGTICGLGAADGLCGCNCYHDYFPFFPGISERAYTDDELEKLKIEENTPREFGGKQYTKYQATQRQRALERTMRAQRQEISLLQTGGASEEDITTARARYRMTSSEYTRFSKAMDLPQQRERVTVDGLGNVGVGKYTMPASKMSSKNESTISAAPISHSKEEYAKIVKYANDNGINIYHIESFDGDTSVLKGQINALREVREEFGLNSKLTLRFEDMESGDLGKTSANGSSIIFDRSALRNRELTNDYLRADNFLATNDVKGIAYHETGHLISQKYGEKGFDIARQTYYNIYKKEISNADLLDFLEKNISEYSARILPDKKDKPFKSKFYKEITPEIFSMNKTNPNEFTEEFVRLLKESCGL